MCACVCVCVPVCVLKLSLLVDCNPILRTCKCIIIKTTNHALYAQVQAEEFNPLDMGL